MHFGNAGGIVLKVIHLSKHPGAETLWVVPQVKQKNMKLNMQNIWGNVTNGSGIKQFQLINII